MSKLGIFKGRRGVGLEQVEPSDFVDADDDLPPVPEPPPFDSDPKPSRPVKEEPKPEVAPESEPKPKETKVKAKPDASPPIDWSRFQRRG